MVVALKPPPEGAVGMVTWGQFGAYASVAVAIFAGGVGICWLVLWRQ
jgi:hypothetical protein